MLFPPPSRSVKGEAIPHFEGLKSGLWPAPDLSVMETSRLLDFAHPLRMTGWKSVHFSGFPAELERAAILNQEHH